MAGGERGGLVVRWGVGVTGLATLSSSRGLGLAADSGGGWLSANLTGSCFCSLVTCRNISLNLMLEAQNITRRVITELLKEKSLQTLFE